MKAKKRDEKEMEYSFQQLGLITKERTGGQERQLSYVAMKEIIEAWKEETREKIEII